MKTKTAKNGEMKKDDVFVPGCHFRPDGGISCLGSESMRWQAYRKARCARGSLPWKGAPSLGNTKASWGGDARAHGPTRLRRTSNISVRAM